MLKQVDANFLCLKQEIFLGANKDVRRQELSSIMGSSAYFYFGGHRVYTQSLFEAFRFIIDMLKRVRHKSRDLRLGESTKQSSRSVLPVLLFKFSRIYKGVQSNPFCTVLLSSLVT